MSDEQILVLIIFILVAGLVALCAVILHNMPKEYWDYLLNTSKNNSDEDDDPSDEEQTTHKNDADKE